jgi:CHRD domain
MGQDSVVRKRFVVGWIVVLAGLVLAICGATAMAGGGNSDNAQMCQKGGWENLVQSDGTGFSNPGDCVSYGAQGGTLHPVYVFTADLSGANENPAVPSSGTGTATVTWNTATNQMTVDVSFSGLTSGTTASHIHCCAVPPTNAGVATQVPRFTGFPTGVTSGTYTHTFDMTDAASYNPAFVTSNGGTAASAEAVLLAGMLAGQSYLNIHTTNFGSGEIRGVLNAA